MACDACGDKQKKESEYFPKAVVEINNPESLILLRKVVIPVSMGTEEDVPPTIGKYFNVLLQYEANGHIYLYSSDGIPTAIEANIPQEIIDRIENLEIEDTRLHNEIEEVANNLADETTAREVADSALGSRIDTVVDNLAAETANRINADEGLQADIATETTARQNADTALGNRVTAIEEKIPNQASAQNQLADKDFVNSSVATNTANYISNNGQPFNSLAELEAYSGTLTNNDYAFVVGTDSAGNTTYTRYKYVASTSSWAEEYVLNNSSFTAVQWATINSGITSGDVSKLNNLANIQTIGANLTLTNGELSATDTTYTAGTGLSLIGTQFSVDTTAIATQSDLTAGLATKQDTLTAGANIQISSNTISATDTTYSDFTGTDGTTAGSAGLVPAPATTDAGKFLKADGTWDTGGSSYTAGEGIDITSDVISVTNTGKAKVLTSADYNYPTNAPDGVALWMLEPGLYYVGSEMIGFYYYVGPRSAASNYSWLISHGTGGVTNIYTLSNGNSSSVVEVHVTHTSSGSDYSNWGASLLATKNVVNNLTSTSTGNPLSAAQGKVLKDLVDSIAIRGAGAPTTSTVGSVGTLYEDTTNGDLYICTDATNPYVWEEVGAGGGSGPTVVQTTGTSTTDVMSQNAVTSMVFADPVARRKIRIGDSSAANGAAGVAIGYGATANSSSDYSVAIGDTASVESAPGGVALGAGSRATVKGQMDIGTIATFYGYNNSNYRLLTGLYDPQSAHDAATKGYVDTSITTAISGITGVEFEVVQTLPATGDAGTIYLVPNQGTTPNIYDEYIYVNNTFEKIGTTEIDLSNYVTTTDLNTALANYTTTANLATVATTGDYNDLINAPAAFTAAEWDALWA